MRGAMPFPAAFFTYGKAISSGLNGNPAATDSCSLDIHVAAHKNVLTCFPISLE
jgi:hypothetical protein